MADYVMRRRAGKLIKIDKQILRWRKRLKAKGCLGKKKPKEDKPSPRANKMTNIFE